MALPTFHKVSDLLSSDGVISASNALTNALSNAGNALRNSGKDMASMIDDAKAAQVMSRLAGIQDRDTYMQALNLLDLSGLSSKAIEKIAMQRPDKLLENALTTRKVANEEEYTRLYGELTREKNRIDAQRARDTNAYQMGSLGVQQDQEKRLKAEADAKAQERQDISDANEMINALKHSTALGDKYLAEQQLKNFLSNSKYSANAKAKVIEYAQTANLNLTPLTGDPESIAKLQGVDSSGAPVSNPYTKAVQIIDKATGKPAVDANGKPIEVVSTQGQRLNNTIAQLEAFTRGSRLHNLFNADGTSKYKSLNDLIKEQQSIYKNSRPEDIANAVKTAYTRITGLMPDVPEELVYNFIDKSLTGEDRAWIFSFFKDDADFQSNLRDAKRELEGRFATFMRDIELFRNAEKELKTLKEIQGKNQTHDAAKIEFDAWLKKKKASPEFKQMSPEDQAAITARKAADLLVTADNTETALARGTQVSNMARASQEAARRRLQEDRARQRRSADLAAIALAKSLNIDPDNIPPTSNLRLVQTLQALEQEGSLAPDKRIINPDYIGAVLK